MICHICKTEIKKYDSHHIKRCAIENTINCTKLENRYNLLIYNYNFVELKSKDELEKYYSNASLPDFTKNFGINYPNVYFLLDYYDIPKRTSSESCKKIAQPKSIKTNLDKYGAVNVLSKGTVIYDKKNKTVKEKYGVSNVFQLQDVIKKINTVEAHAKQAIGWKKWYYNLTQQEKDTFLNNSIHTLESKQKVQDRKGYRVSNLEHNICNFLDILNITYTRQFRLKKPKTVQNKYNNKYFFYDIFITDYNLIIEINGDYWHANPNIYKPDDIITYIYGHKTANDIWIRDDIKNNYAIDTGYALIVIWENEIYKKNDEEIKNLLLTKLSKYEKYKN